MGLFEEGAVEPPVTDLATPDVSARAEQAGRALSDALEAFKIAGITDMKSEDVRSLAISFLIAEDRVPKAIARYERSTPPVVAKKPYTGERLPFLKVEMDKEYVVTVISDDGEFQGKFGTTHGYTVESEGERYKLTTTAKGLVAALVPEAVVTFKKFKNAENQTRYKVG